MSLKLFTPTSKKQILYSDFHKNLDINPLSSDIALKLNEEAIKEALKNLVLTDKGERLFRPELGGNVRKSLFDNITPVTIKLLEEQIKEVINNYEPRASLVKVDTIALADENAVKITIVFYIRSVQEPITISFFLERTR